MPDKIILHIGAHKTATTALQSLMERAVPAVAQGHAHWFPLNEVRRHLLRPIFLGRSEEIRAFVSPRSEPVLFISEENIAGALRPLEGQFYHTIGLQIEHLANAFPDTPIEVVMAIRNMAGFIPSIYVEAIRNFDFVDFDTYTSAMDEELLSWDHILRCRKELPANVTLSVVPFERDVGGGLDVMIGHLRRSGGLPDFSDTYLGRTVTVMRSSASVGEIRLAATIAKLSPGLARKMLFLMAHHRIQNAWSSLSPLGRKKFNPFSDERQAELTTRYERDLEALTAHLVKT